MLPTLAERLREQQRRAGGRGQERLPWPVPGDPPTALLHQPQQPVLDHPAAEAVVDPAPEEAAPVDPEPEQASPPLAEGVLLLLWALVVLIDGALALVSLLRRAEPEQRQPPSPNARSAPALPHPPGVPRGVAETVWQQVLRSALAATP